MRHRLALSALAIVLAIGCARKADIDRVAPGTGVTVKQANGVSVTGTLVEVTPDRIVVDEKNGARRTIARSEVTSLAMAEIPVMPEPNPASAEAAAQAGAPPPAPVPPGEARERAPMATSGTAAPGTVVPETTPAPAREAAATAPRTVREITIPAGTILPVRLETAVGSDTSQVEDTVRGTLTRAVRVGGASVVPAGSAVIGSVTSAVRPGKVKGRSYIAMRFHTLIADDDKYVIRTGAVARRGRATKKKDAAKIGIPAAGGAVIGGIVGGKKGAAIGGAAAGGAGTAVVLNTRGEEVRLGKGEVVSVRLAAPVTIRR